MRQIALRSIISNVIFSFRITVSHILISSRIRIHSINISISVIESDRNTRSRVRERIEISLGAIDVLNVLGSSWRFRENQVIAGVGISVYCGVVVAAAAGGQEQVVPTFVTVQSESVA